MGCTSIQVSGQPASSVEQTHELGQKYLAPMRPVGPGQYDLMVIGDIPSVDDDKMDMVWADSSGEAIIEFLKKAGHDLDKVWMTKIVKCRPRVRGRKPTVKEINTCRDTYLRKEIELIQPKVVILVGAQTLRAFNLIGLGSLNTIRGRVFDVKFPGWDDGPTFKVIPTLNPATFFFRPNPKLMARIGHDYVIAKQLLDGKEATEHFVPKYHLIDTPEKLKWLQEKLLGTSLFGWDTESCKLGFRKAPVICYQFAWGWEEDQCAVLPMYLHDPDAPKEQEYHLKEGFGAKNEELVTQFMRKVFLTPHISKAAHYHKYDVNVLRWGYGIKIEGFLFDTWTMKHLMDEVPPSDLEFLCDLEFAWGDYAAAKRKITGSGKKLKATYDKVPDEILWPYAATDALGTYRLACVYAQRLQQRPNLWTFHQVESEPIIRSLAKAEYKGAFVDPEVLDLLSQRFEKEQKSLLTRMRGAISKPDFNPSSNPQVLQAFFDMGVSDVELEDNKAASGYSANKKKLNDLVEAEVEPASTFASNIMTYRNRTKMISTYITNCRDDMDTDGRVRYSWVIAGPVTGRLSCRFFHQIPKIDEDMVMYGPPGEDGKPTYVPFDQRKKDKRVVMRDMFIAPPGYKYVYGDFSQIELRILAIIARDLEMMGVLSSGDLHRVTAFEFLRTVWEDLTESGVSKFNRTEVGKRINFGLAYGSEGHALVKTGKWMDWNGVERNFTWDMLNAGMKAWKERFKGVGEFIDLTPDLVRGFGGTATNVFGRERHFGPLLNHYNDYERGKAERECINFFIQSVAAAITNRTIIAVDKMLEEHNIPEGVVCLVNTVHDSVAYEVKDEYVDWFMEALKVVSQIPYPELENQVFKIDCGYGVNWTDAEMAA